MRRPRAGSGRARRPLVTPLLVPTALLLMLGCTRGSTSDRPPIHLNPNMDDQPRLEAQEASVFFADGAAMRPPVQGTVARGDELADPVVATGQAPGGEPVATSPVPDDPTLLARGAERYAIFCAPCHAASGDGDSMLRKRSGVATASLLEPRLRTVPDGYLFDVITEGFGLMPSYAYQIPIEDRWAIVAHMRRLQREAGPAPTGEAEAP